MTYFVIAHYRAAEETGDTVAALLRELARESRKELGNVSYDAARDLLDSDHFVIAEKYTSPEAFDAHRQSAHFQKIGLSGILPLLAERVIERYSPAN